ncbi:efflux RND transporter periplasmic adaptor subunit [Paraflavisolibacter sp. H34]|uniref:efflux RND transporter periplasmic adaptor subunit n=1 Tax=Huijunlia imazamoxiresistens TaxID=3127457 RepID=UPI00301AED77
MNLSIFGTAAVLAVFLASCGTSENEKPLPPATDLIPVNFMLLSATDDSSNAIEASGSLFPAEEARLSFKVGGVIDRILVQDGQYIRKGQLLATLQNTEIDAQVQQVQLAYEKATRDYKRADNLFKDSVATREQLENSRTGADLAYQQVQQAQYNRRHARIYAPADGFVIRKLLNEGEITGAGLPVLQVGAYAPSGKWVMRLSVSDRQWAALQLGNPATIQLDAFPDRPFTGVVHKKSLVADPITGSFTVEVKANLTGVQPAAGMFGNVRIRAGEKLADYSIPYNALLEANGKEGYVFVSNNRKQVKKVQVHIRRIGDDRVYVSDGLENYRYLVVSGASYLKDNGLVNALP